MTCNYCGATGLSVETGAIIICTGPFGGAYCSWVCYEQKRKTVTH